MVFRYNMSALLSRHSKPYLRGLLHFSFLFPHFCFLLTIKSRFFKLNSALVDAPYLDVMGEKYLIGSWGILIAGLQQFEF